MSNANRLILLFSSCLVLSACTDSPEKLVSAAAQQRWQALLQGDVTRAYEYYSRAYQKTVPLDKFEKSIKGLGVWKDAQVVGTKCQAERCQVDVNITVAVKMRGLPDPVVSTGLVQEMWIKDTGWRSEWRYVKK